MATQLPNGNALGEFVQKNLWAILMGGLIFYQTFVGYGHRLTEIERVIEERRNVVAQAAVFDARISALEKATDDRFTGRDGVYLERRIERIEKRFGLPPE